MSDTSDRTSCISHRPLVHYFIVHEDYLEVAKVSEHQYKLAAFWRVLETKTNDRITYNEGAKEKGQPVQDMWIEIPYSEFVNRCLGVYKASSFQIAAAESERLGFSKSRVQKRARNPLDPHSPLEDYKEYLLDVPALQKAINTGEYPTPIEINSPLLKSIIAKKEAKKQKKAIENNTPGIENNSPPVENNTSAIEINRKSNITVSNSITKIEDTYVVPAFADHNDTPDFSLEDTSQQLSTPGTDLSPESVDKSAQTDNNTSAPLQASERRIADVTTPPTTPESAPDTSDVPTSPSEKPARPARTRKPKVDMKPITPPARPDNTLPFDAQKILAWGDYARQATLPESNRKDSQYQKAVKAACVIEGLGISEDTFLVLYFNWMKGISLDLEPLGDDKLKSDTWGDFPVDLWVFAQHYQTEKGRYQKKKAERINLEKERENAGTAVATHATSMIGVSGLPRFQASTEKLVFRPTPNKKQPHQKRSNVG